MPCWSSDQNAMWFLPIVMIWPLSSGWNSTATTVSTEHFVSVIFLPPSFFCQSQIEMILSGESSIAANMLPLSARLNERQLMAPVNSPHPIMFSVASETEFQIRMCGNDSRPS
uniref:Putative secreted protein n=1 Tax=Anopheles darlingi TaxID=43151 RepID=A0A2M4DD65_ANODA